MAVERRGVIACHRCDGEFEPEELVRHERPRLVLVHCPDCGTLLGQYRDPGRE